MASFERLPQRWLIVLRALADACEADHADAVPTPAVAQRLPDQPAPPTGSARALLRTLRHHGYVRSHAASQGTPVQWAPTPKGRACLHGHD